MQPFIICVCCSHIIEQGTQSKSLFHPKSTVGRYERKGEERRGEEGRGGEERREGRRKKKSRSE
jgi:hypothetical protein